MNGVRSRDDALQALESTLLRQMLQSSGAFSGGDGPGAKLRADMFVETLADVIAKSGGLGLAGALEASLPDEAKAAVDGDGLHGLREKLRALPPAPSGGPSEEPRVTSGFGTRVDPIDGTTRTHTGVDVAAPEGTPVRAAAGGIVRSAGPRGGYGNAVEIDHGDGLTTLYGHNAQLSVTEGQKVTAAEVIAAVGSTGRATGPHLHFEVRLNDRPQNPQRALNAYGLRVEDTVAGRPRSPTKGDAP